MPQALLVWVPQCLPCIKPERICRLLSTWRVLHAWCWASRRWTAQATARPEAAVAAAPRLSAGRWCTMVRSAAAPGALAGGFKNLLSRGSCGSIVEVERVWQACLPGAALVKGWMLNSLAVAAWPRSRRTATSPHAQITRCTCHPCAALPAVDEPDGSPQHNGHESSQREKRREKRAKRGSSREKKDRCVATCFALGAPAAAVVCGTDIPAAGANAGFKVLLVLRPYAAKGLSRLPLGVQLC